MKRDDDLGMELELPWSREAEQSVLGGLMLDNTAWDRAEVLLTTHFFDRRHGLIFGAVGSLINATKPADVITVFERLQCLGQAEECGGLEYLNALAQSVPSAANMRRYAEIVREKADARAIVAAADIAGAIAREKDASATDKLDRINALFAPLERRQQRKAPRRLSEILVERVDHITELHDETKAPGWPTRIPWLDRTLTGGLQPGRVYGIAARPAIGKSSLAESIGLTMASQDLPTLMLSQEMPDGELADRAVASMGRVDYERLQTGRLLDDDWGRLSEAVERGSQLPFYIDDQPALRLVDIRAKARMVKGLKVLIVDYLQLCAGTKGRDTRNAEIEEITRGLKALAKEMGIALIVLSQLNRDVEKRANKHPNLGDLRDSGAIEQDLDVVMFLWPVREFEAEGRRIIGLEVAKNRQGRRGEVGLDFFGATQRWAESTADIRSAAPAPSRSTGFDE